MTRKLMWIFLAAYVLPTFYNVLILRFNLLQLFNPRLTPLTTIFGFGFASLRRNWRAAWMERINIGE